MAQKQANILLITSDQHHYAALGRHNPALSTPNLDRLAAQGTAFSRSYCANPTCTPSRGSIISGMYPSQHGGWSLGTKLPDDTPTLGHELKKAGYWTGLVGKAHFQPLQATDEFASVEAYPVLQDLAFWRTFNQEKTPWYGFDHCELARNHTEEAHVGQHYALWLEENGCSNWRDYFRQPTGKLTAKTRRRWQIPEKYHYNNWIAERTKNLMADCAAKKQPFFLWASFFDPHPPYCVPEPYYSMYDPQKIQLPTVVPSEHTKNPPHFGLTGQEDADFSSYRESGFNVHGMHSHLIDPEDLRKNIAVYFGMVTMLDKYIGKILQELARLGLEEETIVVFTTDHGHFLGQHGLVTKGPFHYEDLIKVPLIVRYPGKVPAGQESQALQSLVDLAPTFLTLTGQEIPRHMTGLDQSPVWLGQAGQLREHIICENHHEPTTVHLKTYVDANFKLTVYYQKKYGELFDLARDPQETNNLWHDPASQDLKSELLLKFLWAELGKEPMWMPRIANA